MQCGMCENRSLFSPNKQIKRFFIENSFSSSALSSSYTKRKYFMNSHLLNNDYLRKIIYDKKCTNNIIRFLLIFSLMQKEHEMQYSFLLSRKDIYLPIIWCFMTFQIHWLTKFCILYSIPKLISRLLLFRGSKKFSLID